MTQPAEEIAAPAVAAEPPVVVAVSVVEPEPASPGAANARLHVRIEPVGPSAERGVAALAAGGGLRRDQHAELGAPAAVGQVEGGETALALLVQAAELSLDDTDLHITLHRA